MKRRYAQEERRKVLFLARVKRAGELVGTAINALGMMVFYGLLFAIMFLAIVCEVKYLLTDNGDSYVQVPAQNHTDSARPDFSDKNGPIPIRYF